MSDIQKGESPIYVLGEHVEKEYCHGTYFRHGGMMKRLKGDNHE